MLASMDDDIVLHQQRASRIRDWLLTLLRFAITRDPADRAAALERARGMDAGLDVGFQ